MVKSESSKDRDRPRSKPRVKSSDKNMEESHEGKSSESGSSSSRKSASSREPKQESTISANNTVSSSSPTTSTATVSVNSSKESVQVVSVSTTKNSTVIPESKSPILLSKKDIYESVVEHENRLAVEADADEHATDFRETSEEFQEVMKDIADLKSSGKCDEDELEELKTEGLLLLAKLRHLNRISKLRLKFVKDAAFAQRQEVDRNHLLLQNLLYEATHLKKQVEAVEEYKGEDDEIELISEEKFYEIAPDSISKPEVTKNDDHLLRIARLEHEFHLRQELTNKCTELEKEKDKVSIDIDMTRKKLESTRPMIQNVLESTKPFQDHLGINLSNTTTKPVQEHSGTNRLPPRGN